MPEPASDDLAAFAAAVEVADHTTGWSGGGGETEVVPPVLWSHGSLRSTGSVIPLSPEEIVEFFRLDE
jgi:hypothetical protein